VTVDNDILTFQLLCVEFGPVVEF